MMTKDMKFIVKVVQEWPHPSVTSVRLDRDGEVCFSDVAYDFYPKDREAAVSSFIPREYYTNVGKNYSREEWEYARNYDQNVPTRDTLRMHLLVMYDLVAEAMRDKKQQINEGNIKKGNTSPPPANTRPAPPSGQGSGGSGNKPAGS